MSKIDVVVGLQWGDEGKGKIVDYLAPKYDIIARFQGGANAGHTLYIGGEKHVLHIIPSGIFHAHITNVIGNGVVLDPIMLSKELSGLEAKKVDWKTRLLIGNRAHLILPTHRWLDQANEQAKGKAKIGSTLKGIGPAYMDKTGRNGIRTGDIFHPEFRKKYELLKQKHLEIIKNLTKENDFDLVAEEQKWFDGIEVLKQIPQISCVYWFEQALRNGKKILAEGAQGTMLDIDSGTYPFVTSSNTITSGVCSGLGVPPQMIGEVIGISKAYCTRVGSGPFPTELFDSTGEFLRTKGKEFGSTTGRPRRCGWIDLPQLRFACQVNGVTQLVITKLDVLNELPEIQLAIQYQVAGKKTEEIPFDYDEYVLVPVYKTYAGWECEISGYHTFSELPDACQNFLNTITEYLQVNICMISNGPERDQLIFAQSEMLHLSDSRI